MFAMENGRVLMCTLKRLKRPATAMDLARQIDKITKVGVRKLMPTLKVTLLAGITHGFIQKKYGKYFLGENTPCTRPKKRAKPRKAVAKRLTKRPKCGRSSAKKQKQRFRKLKKGLMPHQRLGLAKSTMKRQPVCPKPTDKEAVQALMALVGKKVLRARPVTVGKFRQPPKRKGTCARRRKLRSRRPIYKYRPNSRPASPKNKVRRPLKSQRKIQTNRIRRTATTRQVVRIPRGVRVIRC